MSCVRGKASPGRGRVSPGRAPRVCVTDGAHWARGLKAPSCSPARARGHVASLGRMLERDWVRGSSHRDARLPLRLQGRHEGAPLPRAAGWSPGQSQAASLGRPRCLGLAAPCGWGAESQTAPRRWWTRLLCPPGRGHRAPAVLGCPGSLAPSVAMTSTCLAGRPRGSTARRALDAPKAWSCGQWSPLRVYELGNQGRLVPQAGAPRARLRGGGDAGPPAGPAPGPGGSGSREQPARSSSSFQPTACTLLVLQGQVRHGPPGVPAPQSPGGSLWVTVREPSPPHRGAWGCALLPGRRLLSLPPVSVSLPLWLLAVRATPAPPGLQKMRLALGPLPL